MVRKSLVGIAAAFALCAGSTATLAQVGTAFTYQGQLKDTGTAVNGTVDMQFSLWTAASGGSQVGSTVTNLSVSAAEGLLTTSVDFGVNPYTADQALYLQIAVRNPSGSGSYVPMSSRQRLTAAPFSLATRGVAVNAVGNVGIGTSNPQSLLELGSVTSPGDRYLQISTAGGNLYKAGIKLRHFVNGNGYTLLSNESGVGGLGFHIVDETNNPPSSVTRFFIQNSTGKIGIGTTTPFNELDLPTASVVGPSGFVTAPHDVANRGDKVSFGYNYSGGGCGNGFSGMKVAVNPGTNNCGNSMDLTFHTEECNTACPREVMRINGRGSVGIGTTTPSSSFKLDVAGNVRCVSLTQTSSREFKRDIVPLTGALESIMKLNGVTYAWNDLAPEQVRGAHDIGFLADEMNAVLPDIVAKDENGKPIGIDYGKITPVAVEAIKQLKNENDKMKLDNDALKVRLDRLEALLAAQASK